MESLNIAVLLAGVFFLAFGVTAYRYFYLVLGAAVGLIVAVSARKPLLKLPGLSERPGIAGILIIILFVLIGIFLATRFRRPLAFLGGLGTGAFLYRVIAAVWTGGDIMQALTGPVRLGGMELLAGAVCGVFFLLFEFIFALVLTSAVGAGLCTWVLGGRWTFAACLAIGLVAQPLISNRLVPESARGPGMDDRTKTGRRTKLLVLAMLLIPVSSPRADLVVHHVSLQSGKVVLDVGKASGVIPGEEWVILDDSGDLIETVVVSEVFADTSYTHPLTSDRLSRIKGGMRIVPVETYEYNRARGLESEPQLMKFIEKYPDSRYRDHAHDAIDKIRFERAHAKNTLQAYRSFRKKYPANRYINLALSSEEKLAFLQARELGTEESFLKYFQEYPGNSYLTGMDEARLFLQARKTDRVYAYQEFLAQYPRSSLASEARERIQEFVGWADELEFGKKKVDAIRFFGEYGDETAVPLLVGKLLLPGLGEEARDAVLMMGDSAVTALLEVLLSPLQAPALKDQVALILAEIGNMTAMPGLRSYVKAKNTRTGREALVKLEQKLGR